MKHYHRSGCQCPLCLAELTRKHSAAQQLYAILEMQWIGARAAVTHAELARLGIDDAFPDRARNTLGLLRAQNPAMLDNLLTDILD
jgi:hypothetical protein